MATHKPINILEAFAAAPPPLDYVLPNMVAGTVGALVSPGGAGKSMLALQLAAQIAGGPDLLEVGELPTGPVIYLPAEDPPTHSFITACTPLGRTSAPRNGKPWLTAC